MSTKIVIKGFMAVRPDFWSIVYSHKQV